MQTIRLKVGGMTCGGCEDRIARAVRRVAGISAIEADHRSGEVRATFEPERVSDAEIRAAIERAGYEVSA